jgi:ferredoxin--NADP+ reductase
MTSVAATGAHHLETVTWVRHWTDRLFSFKITRPASFRFRSGEFVMIGLPDSGKPIMRAYSIASPSFAETLEFLSIKVPEGPLTSRLQLIERGDQIVLGKKPTGTRLHGDEPRCRRHPGTPRLDGRLQQRAG